LLSLVSLLSLFFPRPLHDNRHRQLL